MWEIDFVEKLKNSSNKTLEELKEFLWHYSDVCSFRSNKTLEELKGIIISC